jgi:malonate decarboxylase delta subunit
MTHPNNLNIGKIMESFKFRFENGKREIHHKPQLIGVVSSGNLEILMESTPLNGQCEIDVRTSTNGFKEVWEAVLKDFHKKWNFKNVRLSINDVGATPAVVTLRLNQAAKSVSTEVD